MILILTRHGQTKENVKGIIQGHLPGHLTKEGIDQAKRLSERLKNEKIDAIYSSDLKRAADTTYEIVKNHPNIPVNYVKELRERDHGSLSGKSKHNVNWEDYVPDGESAENMYKRIKTLLSKVKNKYPQGTVLFVAHGAINRMIINTIKKNPLEKWETIESTKNTSISIFEIHQNVPCNVCVFNCTEHLNTPSHEQCLKWYRECDTPQNIIDHALKVNKVATYLAKELIKRGEKINYSLVDAASLLHDLDKWDCVKDNSIEHGNLTEKILIKKGFPEIGKYAKHHVVHHLFDKKATWEEKLIIYADSRVLYDRIVSLNHRIQDALIRYNVPKNIAKKEIKFCNLCEKEIFDILKIKPDDLEKLND